MFRYIHPVLCHFIKLFNHPNNLRVPPNFFWKKKRKKRKMRFPLHIKKRIQTSYMLVQEKSKINNNGIFYSYPNTYNDTMLIFQHNILRVLEKLILESRHSSHITAQTSWLHIHLIKSKIIILPISQDWSNMSGSDFLLHELVWQPIWHAKTYTYWWHW